MLTVQQKLEHLRTLEIDGNLSEIEKCMKEKNLIYIIQNIKNY